MAVKSVTWGGFPADAAGLFGEAGVKFLKQLVVSPAPAAGYTPPAAGMVQKCP